MNKNSTRVPLSVSLRMAENILALRANDERQKLIHDVFSPMHESAEEMENRLRAAEDALLDAVRALAKDSLAKRPESFREPALSLERPVGKVEEGERIWVEVRLFRQ